MRKERQTEGTKRPLSDDERVAAWGRLNFALCRLGDLPDRCPAQLVQVLKQVLRHRARAGNVDRDLRRARRRNERAGVFTAPSTLERLIAAAKDRKVAGG